MPSLHLAFICCCRTADFLLFVIDTPFFAKKSAILQIMYYRDAQYVLPSVLYSQNVISFRGSWLNVISFTDVKNVQLSPLRYSQNTHVLNSIRYRRNIPNFIQIGRWKFTVLTASLLRPSTNDDFHCVDFRETCYHELNIYSCFSTECLRKGQKC